MPCAIWHKSLYLRFSYYFIIMFHPSFCQALFLENSSYTISIIIIINYPYFKNYFKIFCENRQNLVKQRITPHFQTTDHPNYYKFTTRG